MAELPDYEGMKESIKQDIARLKRERSRSMQEFDRAIKDRMKLLGSVDSCVRRKNGSYAIAAPKQEGGIQAAMGLTQAVRAVIYRTPGIGVLPTQVRDRLVESGFKPSANLLPEIHAALRRLKARGEIAKARVRNRKGYKATPMPKA